MTRRPGGPVLAIIPARSGSKSIPSKNLAPLAGAPLIAHTFRAAAASASLDRVIVSTDDDGVAELARAAGVEVPFVRPPELARDETPMLPVLRHALAALEAADGWRPDIVVLLQPTSPLRTSRHIDEAVALLRESGADSVVSVVEVPHNFTPGSLLRLEGDRLSRWREQDADVLRRQDKPRLYARNGPAVLAVRRLTLETGELYGADTRALVMAAEESIDIDTEHDLRVAACILAGQAGP